MSFTSSNSSSDSIANPQPLRLSSSSKPKSLSEELSSALQSNGSDTSIGNNKAMAYPSPITPSDLLGIPDPSTFSSTTLTPSDSPVQKADAGRKPRPSLLSINTTLGNSALEDSGFTFPQGSPTSMRDSATNSECPGSPRGLGRHGIPQLEEHEGELSSLSPPEEGQLDNPEREMSMGLGIEVTPSSTTTAVTIVGSTPAFGIHAFREQEDQENNALGLYSAEPPKKRQRSAAAVLLGAAVETVIFTSAVALSAYQLLTGKGKQQLEDATMTPTSDETTAAERTVLEPQSEMSIMPIKSAPVNIPTHAGRHRDSGLLGKSLHHNHHVRPHHKSKHSSKSRHGLSASLPHAYEYDHMKEAMTLPGRPNTGTEDNDEQFLRMEAQLTSLIAEGKRALSSRITDWAEA
ncbi:hypothetical protein BGZ80_001384 [Entomortierella chlamydospora]|uniref:Uncharacterized protein n=1 Tax=Entomortierella chlamydospora TaxID=101097 RepID=A0A9P6MRS0_9FUNG|nr:hypothetical protein BGZ80_001384 [Entomortierella chlamydospora]